MIVVRTQYTYAVYRRFLCGELGTLWGGAFFMLLFIEHFSWRGEFKKRGVREVS